MGKLAGVIGFNLLVLVFTVCIIIQMKKIFNAIYVKSHGEYAKARVVDKTDVYYHAKATYTHFIVKPKNKDHKEFYVVINARPWFKPYEINEEILVKYDPKTQKIYIPRITIIQHILELFVFLLFYLCFIFADIAFIKSYINYLEYIKLFQR